MHILYIIGILIVTHAVVFLAGVVCHKIVTQEAQAGKDYLKKAAEKL